MKGMGKGSRESRQLIVEEKWECNSHSGNCIYISILHSYAQTYEQVSKYTNSWK